MRALRNRNWGPSGGFFASQGTNLPVATLLSATVAGVLLGLDSLGVGGNRRLAVALVSFHCFTCLFNGCLTIV